MTCTHEGCSCRGVFVVVPRCHIEEGLHAEYEDGVLTLKCRECKAIVTRVLVATAAVSELH